MHRTPYLSDWDRGIPDFAEEAAVFKRDLFFAAVLIAAVVSVAYVVIYHF